jgi:23S rRNA (adenine2503-C2)-methyltransferase
MDKINLKGLTLAELEGFAISIGEKRFRGKQLFEWIYTKRASSFQEMSAISRALRDKLSGIASIPEMKIITGKKSRDGTEKFLLKLHDGNLIESVLIPPSTAFTDLKAKGEDEQKRLTLCVSTQAGCPLKCRFCATGSMGFYRNLTTGEIIDQMMMIEKYTGKRITNLVFMGMGEPLLNYDAVVNSIDIFTSGMAIAARHITVSTVGLVPQIGCIAEERRKFKLAISLHSLDDEIRASLIPVATRYRLSELINAVEYYYRMVKRRPTFEYILFKDLNDRDRDVKELVKLSKRIPCKVNIIPYHDIDLQNTDGFAMSLQPTPMPKVEEFVRKLRESHVTVFIRSSAGENIKAACGQLAVQSTKMRSINVRGDKIT